MQLAIYAEQGGMHAHRKAQEQELDLESINWAYKYNRITNDI